MTPVMENQMGKMENDMESGAIWIITLGNKGILSYDKPENKAPRTIMGLS